MNLVYISTIYTMYIVYNACAVSDVTFTTSGLLDYSKIINLGVGQYWQTGDNKIKATHFACLQRHLYARSPVCNF